METDKWTCRKTSKTDKAQGESHEGREGTEREGG